MTAVAAADVDRFHRTGWLRQPAVFDAAMIAATTEALDVVTTWAHETPARGLHHWEQTDHGPVLARSEDLLPHHGYLRGLITTGVLPSVAGALLGEDAVLFKEKVNYKHPGGAGFAPHQDAIAYRFVDHHVSCMVPIDPATEASGCLWVVSGRHDAVLPTDAGGRIEEVTAEGLEWQPVEVEPGDVLWFDSYTPHRSGTNTSHRPRRALYLTYNAVAAGDHRDRYYADKRAELAARGRSRDDERVRVSITDDFLGRPVPGRW